VFAIAHLVAQEILDSRGRPTIRTQCTLDGGGCGSASVPSGASTGAAEAMELRDGDPTRYSGLGCRRAVANVNQAIFAACRQRPFRDQSELDAALVALDGTANKSRLGANAILSVSLAFARAAAAQSGLPLYEYFAQLAGWPLQTLPRLTVNLFSGGKHAGGQTPIQDVLIVPASARDTDEALAMTFAVYQAAAELCGRKYGQRLLRADEGGQAPPFASAEAMLDDAVAAIRAAGLGPGGDVMLAVDIAASHFYADGHYQLADAALDSVQMIERLARWVAEFPIVSLEDGLAQDDWEHWPALAARLGSQVLVVGDDLLCTHPDRIRRAIRSGAATALLLKVNQIGTVSEALEACQLARQAGWQVTVSARSGETEDDWLADLAVGCAGDQLKVGSITQSERLAKYNRLLAIERTSGLRPVAWPLGSTRG
jgi:enolase